MNLQKIINAFSNQDPYQKQLQKLRVYTDTLTQINLQKSLQYFNNQQQIISQQDIIKSLVKNLENKGSVASKLKIISLLLQISKVTQFDIADIILSRKIKIFTKVSKLKYADTALDKKTIQIYICSQLIIPIYNYLMKLSVNQQLYKTCFDKKVPFNDIFRRGSKIRFIWIFKVYNLINLLMPLLESIIKIIKVFPKLQYCKELSTFLYLDLVIMNNFIVNALNQAAYDNFLVMPYFDMLQFYQSLKEQFVVSQKIFSLYKELNNICNSNLNAVIVTTADSNKDIPNENENENRNRNRNGNEKSKEKQYFFKQVNKFIFDQPLKIKIDKQKIQSIEVQALRVKLISNTLKNPKKDHTRLQTQYRQKHKSRTFKNSHYATQNQDNKEEQFMNKFKNLD